MLQPLEGHSCIHLSLKLSSAIVGKGAPIFRNVRTHNNSLGSEEFITDIYTLELKITNNVATEDNNSLLDTGTTSLTSV